MKINWTIIQFVIISTLVIFLFGFANHRNGLRKITQINIHFLDENPPFITEKTVNKLLIQNTKDTINISKEALDLKEVENRLQTNPMIKKADVYLTIDGQLNALIKQRKPLARVVNSPDYYIDEDGKKMPLSKVYTARVPLVSGAVQNVKDILPFLKQIQTDSFFNKMIVAIEVTPTKNIIASCRKNDFVIDFGTAKDLNKKFRNFKAFYTKKIQDSTLKNYNKISLKYGNQVIATKK